MNGIAVALMNGTVVPSIMAGRLSASDTDALPLADVAPTSTLYYLPYQGQLVSLYSGSAWVYRSIGTGISRAVAGLTANQNYDIFMYDSGGAPALDTPVAWTAHGAGTSTRTDLAMQDGIWVKDGAPTRRYVGTIRTVTSSGVQVTDTRARRFVWNMQNRVERVSRQLEDDASWTYASTTQRVLNGAADDGDWTFEYVVGLAEDPIQTIMQVRTDGGSSAAPLLGVGNNEDIMSVPVNYTSVGTWSLTATVLFDKLPSRPGYHFRKGIEAAINTNPYTIIGLNYSMFHNRGRF